MPGPAAFGCSGNFRRRQCHIENILKNHCVMALMVVEDGAVPVKPPCRSQVFVRLRPGKNHVLTVTSAVRLLRLL